MTAKAFDEFAVEARAAGFDEILERRWAPDTNLDTHTHDFDARGFVTQGDMWLTCNGVTRHLTEGDTFSVARLAPHSERYGPHGATYWAARRGAR